MNTLEKGNYYTIQEIEESGLQLVSKTATLLFYKSTTHLYVFHIVAKAFKGIFKHLLISIQLEND